MRSPRRSRASADRHGASINQIAAIESSALGSAAVVRAVLEELLASSAFQSSWTRCCVPRQHGAARRDGVQLLRDHLLARCTLVTPNLPSSTAAGREAASTALDQSAQAGAAARVRPGICASERWPRFWSRSARHPRGKKAAAVIASIYPCRRHHAWHRLRSEFRHPPLRWPLGRRWRQRAEEPSGPRLPRSCSRREATQLFDMRSVSRFQVGGAARGFR